MLTSFSESMDWGRSIGLGILREVFTIVSHVGRSWAFSDGQEICILGVYLLWLAKIGCKSRTNIFGFGIPVFYFFSSCKMVGYKSMPSRSHVCRMNFLTCESGAKSRASIPSTSFLSVSAPAFRSATAVSPVIYQHSPSTKTFDQEFELEEQNIPWPSATA